jgi:hypothetical protein
MVTVPGDHWISPPLHSDGKSDFLGKKDIGQFWMKPAFQFETPITFLALKTTKCCLNKHYFSRKVGIR